MSTKEKFDLATKIVQSLPKEGSFTPDQAMQLKFYGYYKQANIGKCNTSQPWAIQMVERAKWDAWNALGDMSSEEAMKRYAEEFYKSLEGKSFDEAPADTKAMLEQFVAMMKA